MAAGVIRSFLVQAPAPAYFPLIFQPSPCNDDEMEENLEVEPEERGEEDERDEEEEEEEEECEVQEEEDSLSPPPYALDVTKQLLRFADLISRDVQKYFGRASGDQDCDVYSGSSSVSTSGRLRYYDDLLRIAKAGSPEEQENCFDRGVAVAKGNGNLGPLAELFDHGGPNQGRGRPMMKRHLPLSFWTEPASCCPAVGFTHGDVPSQDVPHTDADTHMHYSALSHHNTHSLDGTQPDFSDLLANWDPNPELTHTLTENTHMQH